VLAGHLEERPPLPDVVRLVERALGEGRDARELRQRVAVEESRLRLARTGWVPDLTAGAGAEFDDPDFSVGPQFSLGLTMPLFNRKGAEQSQARAALEMLSREREGAAAAGEHIALLIVRPRASCRRAGEAVLWLPRPLRERGS